MRVHCDVCVMCEGIAGNAVPMHTMLNSPGAGGAPTSNPVVVKHELLNPAAMVST